ncbi:MAG: hypothetical protein WC889_04810, partial [Myxococcota bacterium]
IIRTARARISGENLFVVLLIQAPPSQELEPPTIPVRFKWYDDYFITQSNNFEGGGYDLLTLGATIAPPGWRGIAMDLVVTNALDREYYFFFGGRTFQATHATPGPPRQFRVTVRGSF